MVQYIVPFFYEKIYDKYNLYDIRTIPVSTMMKEVITEQFPLADEEA